jgi:hypothetical protein
MASKHQMTGMLGVYLVAAELSKHGFIVSPTSRSAAGEDSTCASQLIHQFPQVPPRLRIEARRRLIKKQQVRIAYQGASHRKPLLLPARERAHARAPLLFELSHPDRLVKREPLPIETAEQPQGSPETACLTSRAAMH